MKKNEKKPSVIIQRLPHELEDLSAIHVPSKGAEREAGQTSETSTAPSSGTKTRSVLGIALAMSMLLATLSIAVPDQFGYVTETIKNFISTNFGWYYLLLVAAIVGFCIYFIASPVGQIRLGNPGDKPKLSNLSWIAMLFSAGMGIGLVFWGAAEPLSHFAQMAPEAEIGSTEALRDAFRYSFFHWGISAWAIYALVALALAYFRFRKKEKSLLSVTLKPLFGEKAEGAIGKTVDIITAFATIVGVATSLGLGALQINGGLSYLFGIPESPEVQIIIIAVVTVIFLISSALGLAKGMRFLSNGNVITAALLIILFLIIGPAQQIFDTLITSVGGYIQNFIGMSLFVAPFDTTRHEWIESWTIFYWAWWISWSPFVGTFIARISRGRTIREFLVCVILVPTAFSCIWFSVFGALSTGAFLDGADLLSVPTEAVLFATLQSYPAALPLSLVVLVLIVSFFVTSADSATYVLGMITENGSLTPRRSVKVFWGILLSVMSATLLIHGGLESLQNVLIISAFPFSIVLLLIAISLVREFKHERQMMGLYITPDTLPKKDKPFRSYEDEPPENPIVDKWHEENSTSERIE